MKITTMILRSLAGLCLSGLVGACSVDVKSLGGATGGLGRPPTPIEMLSDVTAVDPTLAKIEVFQNPSITVQTDAIVTTFEDREGGTTPFTLSDLKVGDHVKITAFPKGDTLIAVDVVRTRETPQAELKS